MTRFVLRGVALPFLIIGCATSEAFSSLGDIPPEVSNLARLELEKRKVSEMKRLPGRKTDLSDCVLGNPVKRFYPRDEAVIIGETFSEKNLVKDFYSCFTDTFPSSSFLEWGYPILCNNKVVKEFTITKSTEYGYFMSSFGVGFFPAFWEIQKRYPKFQGYKTFWVSSWLGELAFIFKDGKVQIAPIKVDLVLSREPLIKIPKGTLCKLGDIKEELLRRHLPAALRRRIPCEKFRKPVSRHKWPPPSRKPPPDNVLRIAKIHLKKRFGQKGPMADKDLGTTFKLSVPEERFGFHLSQAFKNYTFDWGMISCLGKKAIIKETLKDIGRWTFFAMLEGKPKAAFTFHLDKKRGWKFEQRANFSIASELLEIIETWEGKKGYKARIVTFSFKEHSFIVLLENEDGIKCKPTRNVETLLGLSVGKDYDKLKLYEPAEFLKKAQAYYNPKLKFGGPGEHHIPNWPVSYREPSVDK